MSSTAVAVIVLPEEATVQFVFSVVPTRSPVSEANPASVTLKQRVLSLWYPVAPAVFVNVRAKVVVESVVTELGPAKKFPPAASVNRVHAMRVEVSP